MNEKKLTKSPNKKLCGVCAGIAEYFAVDPTLVRLGFVLFGFWGPALLAYIIAAIVMPEQ